MTPDWLTYALRVGVGLFVLLLLFAIAFSSHFPP
jgi:hypothetical protein